MNCSVWPVQSLVEFSRKDILGHGIGCPWPLYPVSLIRYWYEWIIGRFLAGSALDTKKTFVASWRLVHLNCKRVESLSIIHPKTLDIPGRDETDIRLSRWFLTFMIHDTVSLFCSGKVANQTQIRPSSSTNIQFYWQYTQEPLEQSNQYINDLW